jgi:hypothetical protein
MVDVISRLRSLRGFERYRLVSSTSDLAGCGKSRFGSKLGVFLVTQNHHPRPFLRSWGNCARFVFRAFLPKRLFPQPARRSTAHRFIIAGTMPDNQNERAENDVVALPLTHQELLVVMRCLGIACETERIDAADKQTIRSIRERIAGFAERQGAWWDGP